MRDAGGFWFKESGSVRMGSGLHLPHETIKLRELERTAEITQKAIKALHVSPVTVARIEAIMQGTNEERDQELDRCDQLFYKTSQGIPNPLYS